MKNITLKDDYRLTMEDKYIFIAYKDFRRDDGYKRFCPFCEHELNVKHAVKEGVCSFCKESLKADTTSIKQLLVQENLEQVISVLEENNLLDIEIISELKSKDLKKLNINKVDRKELESVLDINRFSLLCVIWIILAIISIIIIGSIAFLVIKYRAQILFALIVMVLVIDVVVFTCL